MRQRQAPSTPSPVADGRRGTDCWCVESRPGDPELGRLVDNTIWINDAHPAYTRAIASRSLGYHTAVAVALALAPLAVDAKDEHAFVTQFLAQWGTTETVKRAAHQRRKRT